METQLASDRRARPRDDGDGDCYTVEDEDGWIIVKHYPDRKTRRACCRVKIAPDEWATGGRLAALHRAYLAVEKKHAEEKA